jgi:predicted dehydrogenase
MSTKLSIAVIGCGVHGRGGHMQGWKQTEGVELVAVCDADVERAKKAAQEFEVSHFYNDPRQMLESHKLDIVSVVTPPKFHKQNVVDAFAAGANVICEKPLAMNAQEAEEMMDAAKKAGRLMTMGLQMRFYAPSQYLQKFIADGGLGRVYHTRVWAGHLLEGGGIPGWGVFHRRDLSGGGVLFATTVHALDCANWVIGNPMPVSASGSEYQKISKMKNPPVTWTGNLEDCDIEDFSFGFVRFSDGSSMSIESNWLTHPTTRPTGTDILGDFGKATLHPLKITLDDGKTIKDVTPQLDDSQPHYFAAVLQDFAVCVREGRVPAVKFSEMLNVQKVMDAVMESARTRRETKIA